MTDTIHAPDGVARLVTLPAPNRQVLYTVYLPTRDQAGQPFAHDVVDRVMDDIARSVGGCTAMPESLGLWIGPDGSQHRDAIRPLLAIAPDDAKSAHFFATLARRLARELDQLEIFVTTSSVSTMPAAEDNVSGGTTVVARKVDASTDHRVAS